jgi:hypothetical protein
VAVDLTLPQQAFAIGSIEREGPFEAFGSLRSSGVSFQRIDVSRFWSACVLILVELPLPTIQRYREGSNVRTVKILYAG